MDSGSDKVQRPDESKKADESSEPPAPNDCMDLTVKNKDETNPPKDDESCEDVPNKDKNDNPKSKEGKVVYNKDTAMELVLERIMNLEDELKMHTFDDDDESDSDLEGDDYLDDEDEDVLAFQNIDAKTLGFIACAQETMKYLTNQGISRDNPMMVNLRNKLIEEINRI